MSFPDFWLPSTATDAVDHPIQPQEIGSNGREGERPQVPYALELASYAEIFQELRGNELGAMCRAFFVFLGGVNGYCIFHGDIFAFFVQFEGGSSKVGQQKRTLTTGVLFGQIQAFALLLI